jgi:hypothetical protein
MNATRRLDAALSAVCPILGVSVGTPGDTSTVRIDYDPSATAPQRTAAATALAAFDWSDAAQSAWEKQQAIAAAVTLTMTGLSPANISDRVTLRYVCTLLNDVREAVALIADGHAADALTLLAGDTPGNRREDVRILEQAHQIGLQYAVLAGAGEPVGG